MKVHFVPKARKDNPAVKKGEPYYYWKFRYGGIRYKATKPTARDLTQNEHALRIMDFEDLIAEYQNYTGGANSAVSDVEGLRDEVQEYCDELQSRKDNLPEQFQEAGPGEVLTERIESLESFINDLESAISEIESAIDGLDEEDDDSDELANEIVSESFSNLSIG